MKKIGVYFVVLFLLVSCGSEESDTTQVNQDQVTAGGQAGRERPEGAAPGGERSAESQNQFSIETTQVSDFQNNYSIQKIGQILPNQSIDISAQVSGDIGQVYIKEGSSVSAGQTLISLKDNYSKYALAVEKSQIDYDKQIITKESQLLSLNENIDTIKRNLDDAERLYGNAMLTAEEDKKSALIAFENSSTVDVTSSAYLSLEKAQLDYNNSLKSNQQSLEAYIRDAEKEYNNLALNITDITRFGDELYGLSDRYENYADDISGFFGASDRTQKSDTKAFLLELIAYAEYLETLDIESISEDNIISFMATFDEGYDLVSDFLNSLETTINNSLVSVGTLSSADINSYLSQVNSYQGANQGDTSSYSSTLKAISSFLDSYKDTELSALKNLELTQKNYENSEENASISYNKTLINIDNTLASSKKSYDSLKASYDNALANKTVTTRSLDNSISSARNALTQSQVEYSKLNISAPISGVITSIEVDTGEYISSGKQVFTIISDNATQIEVALSESEVKNIEEGSEVQVVYDNQEYTGVIYTIDSLANEALNYNVTVILNEDFGLVGGSAKVLFQDATSVSTLSLPFSLVNVSGDDMGTINILNEEGSLEQLEVTLGNIQGSNIEILSDIPLDMQVITTDLGNYNARTQELIVK